MHAKDPSGIDVMHSVEMQLYQCNRMSQLYIEMRWEILFECINIGLRLFVIVDQNPGIVFFPELVLDQILGRRKIRIASYGLILFQSRAEG